jgi:hypothetical protein
LSHHILAVEQGDKSGGQRYITSAGVFVLISNGRYAQAHARRPHTIAKADPGNYPKVSKAFDAAKVTGKLGIQYKAFEDADMDIMNCIKYFVRYKHVTAIQP